MPGAPEITFIVPCFNYGRYLAECLDSIFGQEGTWDMEVLVIDDASTDDSREVAARYAGRARVIHNDQNLGHAATLTNGLHLAQGTFVSRIDPDDRLRQNFLNSTVPLLRAHPEVGLVYGDVAIIDESGRQTAASCDRVHGGKDFKGNEFVRLLEENFICAPSVIARRQAWLDALPIPDKLAFNDWHFTTMIARRHEFYYVNSVLAEYRVHPANLHRAIAASGAEEVSVFRILDRYYGEVEEERSLEDAKQRHRRRIYAAHYVSLARKYFGTNQYREARRCYLRAARLHPPALMTAQNVRYLAATLMGRRAYETAKRLAGVRAEASGQ